MTSTLSMELRSVSVEAREIVGQVQMWDQTSYLTPDPRGERMKRGCFAKSIRQREAAIPLCLNHQHDHALGMSKHWDDSAEGLTGIFGVRPGAAGDDALADARDGYLPAMSVGFKPLNTTRARDGVLEVREAMLMEVSLCLIGAYEGSRVLQVRNAQNLDELLAPFRNPPTIDLSPVAPFWR